MQVGTITITNTFHKRKQNVMFQAKSPMSIINSADNFISKQTPENKSKKLVDDLLKLIPEDVLNKARFESRFAKTQANCTRALNNKNYSIKSKKKAIDLVFNSTENAKNAKSDKVENYIWKKLVPSIQKNKDEQLAQHVLSISKLNAENNLKTTEGRVNLIGRVRFINALGNKDNLKELEDLSKKIDYDFSDKAMTEMDKIETFYNPAGYDANQLIKMMLKNYVNKALENVSNGTSL